MRPPRPWRPSKLRFEVEAQRSPTASLSGFMARHIEQPGSRHSKPAAMKTSSSPSASAWALTRCEPGTTRARSPVCTVRPRSTSAAARRSSMRELVHEPMNTVSTAISRMRRAGRRGPCRPSARSAASRSPGSSMASGSGTVPLDRASPGPGWCPRSRAGVMAAASRTTSLSKVAPSSVARRAPVGQRRRPSRHPSARGRGPSR